VVRAPVDEHRAEVENDGFFHRRVF
jgi:hypothetical protein